MKTIKKTRRKRRSQGRIRQKRWQVQEAKAKFSELLNDAVESGYQTITKNGEPVAYLVSKDEFDRYLQPKKTLLEVFDECPYPEIDLSIERSSDTIREIDL